MQIKNVHLLNFGQTAAINESRTYTDESFTGYFLHSDKIEFINHHDVLFGKIGLSFGIEYYLEGFNAEVKNQDVRFLSRIIHPMLTNPTTKKSFAETTERKYHYLNHKNYDCFSFEFEWEVIVGNWTFQVLEEDKILLEKHFTIECAEL